jgi:N-acetylmuramoyl-L-alanine amidase
MKVAAQVLLLALALTAAPPAAVVAATARPDRSRAPNRQYVRLGDWARANQFAVRWLERDRTLQLSNRTARLVFNVDPRQDSRKAWINGTEVWLAFPVLAQNGIVRITQLDLEKTLAPVLSPPLNRPGLKLKTICLDPGHGGNDPGFVVRSNAEKKYTLLLAMEVREQLRRAGFNVVLTRSTDVKVPLESRPELARKRGADLFVSLHFNAVEEGRGVVQGVEIFACTPAGATSTNARGEGDTSWVNGNSNDGKNLLLAYQLQKAVVRGLRAEDRGVKRARFAVLREATIPAVLIEGGFMSHPREGTKIFDPAYRRQMARAIVDGILNYRNAVRG